MATATASDKGVGLGLLFGAAGLIGTVAMLVGGLTGDQITAGMGLSVAIAGGALAIAASHLYG